ncbi:MAG: Dabb family protein [Sulfurimonas sp.]|nr:MAG: Dabb family protein [Sulfurimonas sp.]
MIVHIVMFKLKEDDKNANLVKIRAVLEQLPKKIEELVSMEVGLNFDESDRAFDLSLYSTFKTKEDLAIYASHKEHLKVVDFIKTVVTESKVVDYRL